MHVCPLYIRDGCSMIMFAVQCIAVLCTQTTVAGCYVASSAMLNPIAHAAWYQQLEILDDAANSHMLCP